jgi:hypothetical protein
MQYLESEIHNKIKYKIYSFMESQFIYGFPDKKKCFLYFEKYYKLNKNTIDNYTKEIINIS